MRAIVTLPAYAEYVERAAARDIVEAVRFNTVLPVRERLEEFLDLYRQRVAPKPLWIDLKCRQLRIVHSTYIPYHMVELSHRIQVRTPVTATFCAGEFSATVRRVEDGNRLVIEEISPVPLGSGMSVAINDPSLVIEGYLTDRDRAYIAAARQLGLHNFMLSYVEEASDLEEVFALDPEAQVLAKIESTAGLRFVEEVFPAYRDRVRLMTGRGDLYHELEWPHQILRATRDIVRTDPRAVAASRILSAMRKSRTPPCAELGDVGFLLELGYRTLLLGDEICFHADALFSALAVLEAIDRDYC